VDEVYLETLFDQPGVPRFIWIEFCCDEQPDQGVRVERYSLRRILAQPELIQRMWQIIDFTYGSPGIQPNSWPWSSSTISIGCVIEPCFAGTIVFW